MIRLRVLQIGQVMIHHLGVVHQAAILNHQAADHQDLAAEVEIAVVDLDLLMEEVEVSSLFWIKSL